MSSYFNHIKYTFLTAIFILSLGISSQAQEMDFFEPKSSIGGYGELHYNYSKPEDGDASELLDFHRFIIFYSHSFTEKWSFKSEVELEHNLVGDDQGELELEQAYVNYHHADYFGFRAGVVLNGVGLINEYHEPPLFLSVERPAYSKYIIPTTWFGNGGAVYGSHKGFDYKLTVMESMNADTFSDSSGLRDGRQKGYKVDAETLLYNFKVDYTGISGLRVGTSFTYNEAKGANTGNKIPFSLFEVHAKYNAHNIYSVFEFGNVSYREGNLETSMGYYLDLGYNVGSLLDYETEIIPFVRYTDYNPAASVGDNTDQLEEQNQTSKVMFGVAVKPHPEIVFKADFAQKTVEFNEQKSTLFNLGVGYMF